LLQRLLQLQYVLILSEMLLNQTDGFNVRLNNHVYVFLKVPSFGFGWIFLMNQKPHKYNRFAALLNNN